MRIKISLIFGDQTGDLNILVKLGQKKLTFSTSDDEKEKIILG